MRKTDSEFARELFSEEERLYAQARNKKKATCLVCMEVFNLEEQFLTETCFHEDENVAICMPCARDYVKTEVNASNFPIKCFVPNCDAEFKNSDLELLLDLEEMKRVERLQLQKLLATSQSWFPCLKPGCENGVFFDEDATFTRFTCPGCKSIWCVKCKDAFHDNETCDRFQAWKQENGNADNALQQLIKQRVVKVCPQCKTPTQKAEGCNFMTCQRCHVHWCW